MTSYTGMPTAVADAFVSALNAHDSAKLAELMTEDVTYWEANLPAPIVGRKAVHDHFVENWKSFPDAALKVINRIASGDWVVDETEWSATNKGPIKVPGQPTIPPTGRRVRGTAVGVAKVEGGKVKRMNIYYDQLPMLAQLGLMPPPGSR